ncbi:hypothetical protein MMC19_005530 [Ptychographa xylographoides]|nr:hypothetical protein [Ptychographa xylographoides]
MTPESYPNDFHYFDPTKHTASSALKQAVSVQHLYGAPATTYDATWHVAHAFDFTKWAFLSPGQHVLDLACGTGLVSLPTAKAVGSCGTVTAVEFTAEMLTVAEGKARKEGLNIQFLQHDITSLDSLGLRHDYDAITCASAIPLLEDLAAAVKHWATFLKPGGLLAVDVPTEKSQIPGIVFENAAAQVGVKVQFGRSWIYGPRSLENVVIGADLEIMRSFVAKGYASSNVYSAGQAEQVFDAWVGGPVGKLFPELSVDAARREKARIFFIEEFGTWAGEDGMVREEEGFYVVVGRKA